MWINIEPLKKWFGYSRKERRATVILILLIVIVYLARFTVSGKQMAIEDLTPELVASLNDNSKITESAFLFDPNIASLDTLIRAGLNEREARTLVNYRNKGGRFRKPADINRLYGIDSVKAASLIPNIRISQPISNSILDEDQKLIELNSCDSAALEKLPGIGPVLSSRIIRFRNYLGGFASVDQLKEVYGLPAETFTKIRIWVYVDTLLVKKININTADYKALARIPYLERFQVNDILKFRELAGNIPSVEALIVNNILPDSVAKKVRTYLDF